MVPVDLAQLDLAERHEPAEKRHCGASSVENDAYVLVRRRNSRLRFSSEFVVRSARHIGFGNA